MHKTTFAKLPLLAINILLSTFCCFGGNINGTYYSFESTIFINNNILSIMAEEQFFLNSKSESPQITRTGILKSKCKIDHIQGNVFCINSLPIAPFKDMTLDCVPSQNDRQTLTIKFPNYDFSDNLYPIISISKTMFYNEQESKWDYYPSDQSDIVIEGVSDSIVVDFPLYFNDSTVALNLSQNTYVNNTFYSAYMGILTFSDFLYLDEAKKDVTITLPNVSAYTFNSWDLDDILIIIEDNHINLFGIDHIKISDEIITSDQQRLDLYYNYKKSLLQNH